MVASWNNAAIICLFAVSLDNCTNASIIRVLEADLGVIETVINSEPSLIWGIVSSAGVWVVVVATAPLTVIALVTGIPVVVKAILDESIAALVFIFALSILPLNSLAIVLIGLFTSEASAVVPSVT